MFKRHAKSNMKLIKRSSYALAFVIPFLNLSGESKESTKLFAENQLLFENKEFEIDKAIYQFEDNKYILNSDNFLIAEETSRKIRIIKLKKKEC